MLTREKAKFTICPYKCTTDAFRVAGNGSCFIIKCSAEECPKWVDEIIRLTGWNGIPKAWCSHFEACPFLPDENSKSIDHEKYLRNCLDCSHHFGRCGG